MDDALKRRALRRYANAKTLYEAEAMRSVQHGDISVRHRAQWPFEKCL